MSEINRGEVQFDIQIVIVYVCAGGSEAADSALTAPSELVHVNVALPGSSPVSELCP